MNISSKNAKKPSKLGDILAITDEVVKAAEVTIAKGIYKLTAVIC